MAKQRSIHNNYLTLPVVFTMLSNHYSFTYASPRWSWLILACIFVASFLVRHWFNTLHAASHRREAGLAAVAGRRGAGVSARSASACWAAVGFGRRCRRGAGHLRRREADRRSALPCLPLGQAAIPGFAEAPKGVMFDTPAQIKRLAPQIMAQAVKTHTMPLGNVTEITEAERSTLGSWIEAGQN